MTRRQANSIRQPRRVSPWPRWLAFVLFFFGIILLARVIILHHLNKKPTVVAPAQQAPPSPPQVQFDFYTVLPKMEVSSPTPPPADSPPVSKAKPAVTATVSPPTVHLPAPVQTLKPLADSAVGMYVLQIAAVRQQQDAERLRDQMHSAGYPAFIQPFQAGEVLWYRVMVGPYASQDLAEHNQSQLKSHSANSLLLKMQPHSN